MARTKKPKPIEAFEINMADADVLVAYARHFTNQRTYRMRRELRERVGDALSLPKRDWEDLDCIESDGVFIVLKPRAEIGRSAFTDIRPLLRQALVAGSAAFETYLGDKVMDFVGAALRSDNPPSRLTEVPLNVGIWMDVEKKYKNRKWGVRRVVEAHVREVSSVAPNQVGRLLSLVGVDKWSRKVDAARSVAQGATVADLNRIAQRRNRIAHAGDRVGQGRARLDVNEVDKELSVLRSVTDAIEAVMQEHVV